MNNLSRTRKSWPVIFLIIMLAMGTPVVLAIDEVVDDYEDESRVDVKDDVVRNSTLDCMELNTTSAIPVYIDFDTYTENDAGGKLTHGGTFSNFTGLERTRDNTYLRYDYGAGAIDDFIDEFELYIDSATPDAVNRVITMLSTYADGLNDWIALRAGSVDQLAIALVVTNSEAGFRIQVRESFAGLDENTLGAVEFDEDTLYYLRFVKENINSWCEIYDDAPKTNLLENITLALDADHTFRYHMAPQSADFGATGDMVTGYINNYWNGTTGGGYPLSGYFTTTNFLDGLSNNATVLLTDTDIPSGSINAQISNDGTVWSDLGVLVSGFGAIDLRALGFTNSTVMFNYTLGLASETPRLFQVRLVHEGNATVGPGVATPVDETPYLAIGLILALAMVLIADKARK